jgi:hypothetical protein
LRKEDHHEESAKSTRELQADACRRTRRASPLRRRDAGDEHLKKYADAFALVRGSVPDRKLSKQLAVCAENQILQY